VRAGWEKPDWGINVSEVRRASNISHVPAHTKKKRNPITQFTIFQQGKVKGLPEGFVFGRM
jgi:hypothetical protein